jgi:hypothetical protein
VITGSRRIPLLQVADLGAFLGTKWVAEAKDGAIPWRPYYDKLYEAGRVWALPRLSKQKLNFALTIFNIQKTPSILDEVWPDK